uniref:receptor protein-tyrosine kinase n=1 Tax=Xiphophorus couchianus TaxID=32473 RepID=A0A3B5M1B2_9TELE
STAAAACRRSRGAALLFLWPPAHITASPNQMTMLDNHYLKMKKMYSGCNVVLENLEITYTQENQDLSFLQSIQEVGGYVLIAMNEVSTIPLVNLRLIRGQNLYEGNFTLLVMSNYQKNPSSPDVYQVGLKQLQLSNLTEILSGGVKVSHNPLLCNVETINWWDIVDKTSNPTMNLIPHAFERQCQKCDPGCVNGSFFHCFFYCNRRCRGPKPIDCCNEHCAGGCTGPRATDCLACRDFNDDGTCKDTCPPPKIYDIVSHQVVDNPNIKYTFGAACVKECPSNYVVTEGACVRSCSAGMLEVDENGKRSCKPCDGVCPKGRPTHTHTHTHTHTNPEQIPRVVLVLPAVCDGIGIGSLSNTIAVNSTNIGSFSNCTKINGDIILNRNSFEG